MGAVPANLPIKPEPPDPGDCCGAGCPRCVLDLYDEQLAAWEAAVAELREKGTEGVKLA